MTQPRKPGANVCRQQQFDPIAVHEIGRMDGDAEHKAFGVDQQMAFAALHLLAGIVAAPQPRRGS
jgi:hypothetical protein